jgi:cytochrome c-type biogenesis protein CcmH
MRNVKYLIFGLLTIGVLLFSAALINTVSADGPGTVSADDVNNVAKKLYCPVCENIPLDTCGTAACAQWRDEIRIQLEQGRTPDEVISDFINRFGDRVVGTPYDPTLRGLSLITPWVLSALALAVTGFMFYRWRRNQGQANDDLEAQLATANGPNLSADEYRARLERDLAQRR